MATVHLPRSLVALFPEADRLIELEATTVADAIRGLDERWPGMLDRLCEPGPTLREHINVFVDRERAGLDTSVGAGSVIHIIPAVSGGESGG